MKIWIVIADDTDYDAGEQWIVGAFSSEQRAKMAIETDIAAYEMESLTGKHQYCGNLEHTIEEVNLDENNFLSLYLNNAM